MLIEVGRNRAAPAPCKQRKAMSSLPFLTSPQASTKMPQPKQPAKLMALAPRTSAADPKGRRRGLAVKVYANTGQYTRDLSSDKSFAISVIPMVTRPVVKLLVSMTSVVCRPKSTALPPRSLSMVFAGVCLIEGAFEYTETGLPTCSTVFGLLRSCSISSSTSVNAMVVVITSDSRD